MRQGCGTIALGLLAFILVIVVGYGLVVGDMMFFQPWFRDQQTTINRNTDQFVDTQVEGIMTEWDGFEELDRAITFEAAKPDGERNDALIQQYKEGLIQRVQSMCSKAAQIPDQYVPQSAQPKMMELGCWIPGNDSN